MVSRTLGAEAAEAAYVHVPFCRHRCGYCNFTLIAGRDDLVPAYLRALGRELSTLGKPRPVRTLYLGGGTPSHLSATDLDRLVALVLQWFPLQPDWEFSLEANPLDLTEERLRVLAGHGVNRLSLGIQSFSDRKLSILERDHRRAEILRAWELAGEFVGERSVDLIFAAPGETLDEWKRDLAETIALAPQHVSTYGLTYERGARFWSRLQKGQLQAIDESLEREMYLTAIQTLSASGYEHYEVSNFARGGRQCRHNLVYWKGEPYYGAGPGAARYLLGRREVNHRSTVAYIRRVLAGQSPVAESEILSPLAAAREKLVFGLRMLAGIDLEQLAQETGFGIGTIAEPAMSRWVELGMLERRDARVRLTRQGLLISDALWPDMLGNSECRTGNEE